MEFGSHQLAYPGWTAYPTYMQAAPTQIGLSGEQASMYHVLPIQQFHTRISEFVANTQLQSTLLNRRLSSSTAKPSSAHKPGQAQADVVAGSIVAFTENVKTQIRDDITNATLFAQLATNKIFNRETQPKKWNHKYATILEKIGFIVLEFHNSSYTPTSRTFKMDKVVEKQIQTFASHKGEALLTSAIQALGELPKQSYSVQLFESQSSSGKQGNFQVCTVDQALNGDASIALGLFDFGAKICCGDVSRFLWKSWNSNKISLVMRTQKMALNETVYAQVRQEIIKKLGKQRQTLVADIAV